MSFLRKLFGRETVDELVARAESEASAGRSGPAKLDFERALERATDDDTKAKLRARIAEMRDALAEGRLAEAERWIAAGRDDDALAEARGAEEVAATESLRDRARALVVRLRTRTARVADFVVQPQSRDDVLVEIAASWGDEQAKEYDAYGDDALDASVALATGEFARARELFEGLLARAAGEPGSVRGSVPEARWLHRDVARARWAAGDLEGADASLVAFFEAVTDEAHDRALFEARLDRARLFEDRGMLDDALAEAGEALDHAADQPRSFAAVARFLRDRSHPSEAREVLEAALTLPGSEADPVIQIELAFAESDEGNDAPALDRLDRVVLALSGAGQEPPRDVQAARARLLARVGRTENAAELHRRLALAFVDDFGFEHAVAAARLHRELGSLTEARELLMRATLLAGATPERLVAIAAEQAALDAP